jgi:hypothetical protein
MRRGEIQIGATSSLKAELRYFVFVVQFCVPTAQNSVEMRAVTRKVLCKYPSENALSHTQAKRKKELGETCKTFIH